MPLPPGGTVSSCSLLQYPTGPQSLCVMHRFLPYQLPKPLVQLPRFSRIPFSLSWWAYSFPLAAITIASAFMFARTGLSLFRIIADGLLAFLLLVVGVLVVRTAAATRHHGLALDEA